MKKKSRSIMRNMQEMISIIFNTDTVKLMRSIECNAAETQKKFECAMMN